jgi:DNA-binding transcriptional LysR family regulator
MDLRDLHYFEVIAELEHVGKAALRLHRSQPALTSCLRRLEEISGGPLIQKTGRGIRLTPAGKVLQVWAKRLRLDAQDATSEMRDAVQGSTGEIRIGLVPSGSQFLFPHVTRAVLAEMPKVKIRIEVATHATLATMLRSGELDFLVVGESYKEIGLVSRTIMEDTLIPATVTHHPIFDNKRPTMRHLSQHSWILQPANVLPRQWLDQAFDRAALPRPNVQIETNMLNLQPELIAESGLLSFLPRKQLVKGGKLKEINVREATMRRRLELRYRERGYISPVARRVIDLLVEVGKFADSRI